MLKRVTAIVVCLMLFVGFGTIAVPSAQASYVSTYNSNLADYKQHEVPIVKEFRSDYNGSLAQAIVGRAIWYMEYGYMVYGHHKYPTTGFIDCSNFTSLVYKDFGYNITSASRNYNTVGKAVSGVYSKLQPGSKTKYMLVGIDKLKPGDIITFWKTNSDGSDKHIGHVAIYMGKINGKPTIIQTVSGRPTAIGITNSFTYWYGQHFYGARRILTSSSQYVKGSFKLPKPVIPAVYQLKPQASIIMPQSLSKGF